MKSATFTFDGKRYRCRGNTYEEAKEKATRRKALLEAHVREVKGSMTVAKWAGQWLSSYKATVSPGWKKQMQSIIDNAIIPAIGDRLVKDVLPIDITRTLAQVSDRSDSYVKKVQIILKQMFSEAEDNDLVLREPTKRAKMPHSREETDRRVITSYERELTLKTAQKHPDDGLFFLLMLYCGLRPQEVAVLKRADIDLKARVIHVTKALKSDDTIGKPKSKAGIRDVPLPLALVPYIPDCIGFICTNTHGEQLTHTSIRGLWHRFRREMEIEHGTMVVRNALVDPFLPDDLTPYCYRHTYCTDLQDAGVPIVVASRLMGHSDIKITAKIYTHASEASFKDAQAKIDAVTNV